MTFENRVKNIAIAGASGQLGRQLVSHLLQHHSNFRVTALSRTDSRTTFDHAVQVYRGDYDSATFLEAALQGQDVLIIALGFEAPLECQTRIIAAAGRVGVPWIIPNEWSSDGANEELCDQFPLLGKKKRYREQIEGFKTSNWIGIANNPWFDFSLKSGWFGIDIKQRKALIFDDGKTVITTTTIPQVGHAVAALLSLPVHSSSSTSLSDYKNHFVYLRSFSLSQNDMLAAVQRATGTNTEDWDIKHRPVDDYINEGREDMKQGDEMGMVKVLYGCTFKKGLGDRYYGKEIANEKLNLPKEDLDEVVRKIVKEATGQTEK